MPNKFLMYNAMVTSPPPRYKDNIKKNANVNLKPVLTNYHM